MPVRERYRVGGLVDEHAEAVGVAGAPAARGGGERRRAAVGHLEDGGAAGERVEAGRGGGIRPGGGRDGRHQHGRAGEGAGQGVPLPGGDPDLIALRVAQARAELVGDVGARPRA
jgi:hypothetical protein